MGIKIALDDFGTGYSSLTYLQRLAVDTLKIDKSFVINMLKEEGDFSILEGVISLANAFNCDTVAEGVESKEHGTALIQLGCEVAQGYYIAKPMPAEDFPNWVKEWKADSIWAMQKRMNHQDLQLMSAIMNHRNWVRDLEHILKYDEYMSISLNSQECKLGTWIHKQGELLYGHKPAFEVVKALHFEVHQLGKRLMKARSQKRMDEANRIFKDILYQSEQMIENIEFLM